MKLLTLIRRQKEYKPIYDFFRNVLGFSPHHLALYHLAFCHRSMTQETTDGKKLNNERLEYLGDTVLSTIVADYLYKRYPKEGEGFLTILRSRIVSRASLNSLARKIGLTDLVEYNHGKHSGFKSMGGDAFEALVGAIYLEKGYKFTRRLVINKILNTYLDIESLIQTDPNYKSRILDWSQRNHHELKFELVRSFFCSHEGRRQFECRVVVDGKPLESAIAYTIKEAEQRAAEKSFKCLEKNQLQTPSQD